MRTVSDCACHGVYGDVKTRPCPSERISQPTRSPPGGGNAQAATRRPKPSRSLGPRKKQGERDRSCLSTRCPQERDDMTHDRAETSNASTTGKSSRRTRRQGRTTEPTETPYGEHVLRRITGRSALEDLIRHLQFPWPGTQSDKLPGSSVFRQDLRPLSIALRFIPSRAAGTPVLKIA